MPGSGSTSAPQRGVVREIYIYKATSVQDVEQGDRLYKAIKSEFVAKTFSNASGIFKVKLQPGEYSVFTKEANGFFGNIFDIKGRINYVVVQPKEYATISILVDYDAVY